MKAITRETLENIDLDNVPTIVAEGTSYSGDYAIRVSTGAVYSRERFTPRARSVYLKPSFAGAQVLIAKDDRDNLIFSNGIWFSNIMQEEK